MAFCRSEGVRLVVIGPEAALEAGLVDVLEAAGVPAFGPSAAAARIEVPPLWSGRELWSCDLFEMKLSLRKASRRS